jgi:hypothetical protein
MTPVMGDGNGEGKATGCGHFQRGRGREGEAAPHCRRQTTQRRAVWRSKVVAGGWRSKMIKINWVSEPNARLGRTADWASKKI